jgi:hypothetical protein
MWLPPFSQRVGDEGTGRRRPPKSRRPQRRVFSMENWWTDWTVVPGPEFPLLNSFGFQFIDS